MFGGIALLSGPQETNQLQALLNTLIGNLKIYGPGLLNGQTGSVGNAADTTDDTLFSFLLPANYLPNVLGTNRGLRVTFWGTSAANGNNKTFKVFFGSVTAISSGVVTINAKSWMARVQIMRSGVSTQKIFGEALSDATDIAPSAQDGAEDETATILIKGTGASGTTGAASDLLGKGWSIEQLS